MTPPNLLYAILLLAAGLICLVLTAVVWRLREQASAATALSFLLLSLSWWDLTYALFWAKAPAPNPYFWLDVTYFGVVATPAFGLIFALQITHKETLLSPLTYFALAVEPLLVLLTLWTDPLHGLFFGGKRAVDAGMILEGGLVFWVNVIYSYLVNLISMILLAREYRRSQGIYRNQFAIILIGLGIPFLNSIVFIAGFNPLPGADNTPFSFTITGLFFAYALFRYRFLDLIPIARSMLIDSMNDGLMVLDAENRVLDMNHAAERWLPGLRVGDSIESIADRLPAVLLQYRQQNDLRIEVRLENPSRYLDVQISSVRNSRGQFLGRLIVWRDITELKELQNTLHDLAIRDGLTKVYNRRHFEQLAEVEWARAQRHHRSLVVLLVDIDHFKTVNDTYGHQAGDRILARFAEICQQVKRAEDLFARWGGEEFIFLLPDSSPQAATALVNRLFQQFSQTEWMANAKDWQLTCSIGGAANTFQEGDSFEALIRRADEALYQAKNTGRNRAVFYNSPEYKADSDDAD
jgi:diguanylate cyclase (GGDEF)-like protein